jgi:hypothetical protein
VKKREGKGGMVGKELIGQGGKGRECNSERVYREGGEGKRGTAKELRGQGRVREESHSERIDRGGGKVTAEELIGKGRE